MRLLFISFLLAGFAHADESAYCRDLNTQIEQVKSEQRRKSTQDLRNRYRTLTDAYLNHCLKG